MTSAPPDRTPSRREVLEALTTALDDPHRLVDVLSAAEDEGDAVRVLGAGFGLSPTLAQAVLDVQFRLLTRRRREAVAQDLRIEQTPVGPPLRLEATFTDADRVAAVTVDGREYRVEGATSGETVEALADVVVEEIARPLHRPVIVDASPGGPLRRFVATPSRSVAFEYWDDETDDERP
ncbi:hypothetical protein [Geodermatophilus sp. URMC 64]